MTLLIDGHNLIGAMPDIDLRDPDDEWQLVERLRSYARGRRHLTVVFDSGVGPAPRWRLSGGGITVRFAPPGTEADEVILRLLRHSEHPSQVTVVTNDYRLADLVRAAGGQVRSASQFARRLAPFAQGSAQAAQATDVDDHDPRDPAFADLYAEFITAERDATRFGTDIALDPTTWIERLYGEDAEEARRAAHWLGRFGGRDALDPLLDALTHSTGSVRAAALLALADLGDPAAAAVVADRLLTDQSTMVREAAAKALARLGGPRADPALRAALGDRKRKVRRAAQAGLAQLAARR